ncbi:MAG: acetate--CoA ligase family protein [bacterium]
MSERAHAPGTVSILSHSVAFAEAFRHWAAGHGLTVTRELTQEPQQASESGLLLELAGDEEVSVIVGYLESITSGKELMKAAEEVASTRPVVLLKAGGTGVGSLAAASRRGSRVSAEVAVGAAFRRAGVVQVDSFEALLDCALVFAKAPLPKGRRVAILASGDGVGVLTADAAERAGLEVTPAGAPAPAAGTVGEGDANPVKVVGDASPEEWAAAIDAVRGGEGVDGVLVALAPRSMEQAAATVDAIAACTPHDKPLLVSFLGDAGEQLPLGTYRAKGLVDFPAPERAVTAFRALSDYAAWRRRPPRVVTRFPVNRHRVERVIARQLRAGSLQVTEVRAKQILRAYNFRVPAGDVATTADEAVEIAVRIGMPVVLKIASPDIMHKTDSGGVRLNLGDPMAVRDAFDLMMLRTRQNVPDARVEGVHVEEMGFRGREVILGMIRDPQLGPMLLFGLGGIFVETMKEATLYPAPITAVEAMQMLEATRSYELLTGASESSRVDLGAIAVGLQRVSQLVTDFPQIRELDINPFIVGDAGSEPYVADARIILEGAVHG